MLERVKTGILTALVILSMTLTFTIWTSIPTNGPIDQPTVLSTVSYGPDKTINQLVFPNQLIVHFSNDKHTVLRPRSNGYNLVLKVLQKSSIYDMKSIRFSDNEWKNAVSGHSIEMQFSWDVPFDIVNRIFPGIKLLETKPTFRTIFINSDANFQNVQVVFMNSQYADSISYVAHLNVSSESLRILFQQLESTEPLYTLFGKGISQSFYLPKDQQQLPVFTYQLETFNLEQLTNSFFVDPSLTKKINEQDGSFIKTDGSRGVSYNIQYDRVQYTDPITNWNEEQISADSQISQAISFANDHGGIPDNAQLTTGAPYLLGSDLTYTINEYVDGIPIDNDLGTIAVRLKGNEVTEFDRSLTYLGGQTKKIVQPALSASQLIEKMAKQSKISISSVTQMDLVYHLVPADKNYIRLQPVYLATENTGVTDYVDALTGELLDRGARNGLE